MRDFISATILSRTSADCALSSRFGDANRSAMVVRDDVGDDVAHGRRAENLLGLALELRLRQPNGEHRGQPGEDVVLLELVGADLEAAGVQFDLGTQEFHHALLEAGLVRAALGRRDDVDEALEDCVVPGAPAQRDVDVARAREFGGHHRARRLQHGHGLGEFAGAVHAPGVGERRVRGEKVDELGDAAREAEGLGDRLGTAAILESRCLMPGTRNAVWRARATSSSVWKSAPRVKICGSAQ